MGHAKQKSFFKTNWEHHLCHGGSLRQKQAGRGYRPLSTKEPLHVVFKVNRERLLHGTLRSPMGHALILKIARRYAKKFFVKIDQITVQGDHCHLLIRAPRRAKFHAFFRVVAGQIAQRLELEGLLNTKVTDTPAGPRKSRGTDTPNGLRNLDVTDTHDGLRNGATAHVRVRNSGRTDTGAELGNHDVTDTPARLRKTPADHRKIKAQSKGTGLWKYRPFSRVVRGRRAYKIVRDYVKLNELEAQGLIPYRKNRLKGLSTSEWEILWA